MQFLTAKIIAPEMRPEFNGLTDRFAALRVPLAALLACLVLAYASAVAYAFVFGTHLAPVVGPNWHLSAEAYYLNRASRPGWDACGWT